MQSTNFRCSGGFIPASVCATASCLENSIFQCDVNPCRCHHDHITCVLIPIDKLKKMLVSQLLQTKLHAAHVFQPLKDYFDNILVEINRQRDALETQAFRVFLSDEQTVLESAMDTENWLGVTQETIVRVLATKSGDMPELKAQAIQNFITEEARKCEVLREYLKDFHSRLHKIQGSKPPIFESESLVLDSKDNRVLLGFFSQGSLEPRGFKLLYRGSLHAFSADTFHSQCDNIPNTLTLVKTEFGKVFGGFTPLVWSNTSHPKLDPSLQSFVFSVSNRIKLNHMENSVAIRCHPNFGPIFGESDFYICDRADICPDSRAGCVNSYSNGILRNDQVSWNLFSGQTKGETFRVIEWEVWEVLF